MISGKMTQCSLYHPAEVSQNNLLTVHYPSALPRPPCHSFAPPSLGTTGVGYKKIAKTVKQSCSAVAKTTQRFNRTGFTQNRPRHSRPKKKCARAQRHIQRLCLGNRRMSAASIAAEVEG